MPLYICQKLNHFSTEKVAIFMDPELYDAAVTGDLKCLQRMTPQQRSNLSSHLSPNNNTLLHVATDYGQLPFARTLLESDPSLLSLQNSSGDTPLHIAAKEDLLPFVNLFIDQSNTTQNNVDIESRHPQRPSFIDLMRDKRNLDMDTPLHCAARFGHYGSLELLLRQDSQVCELVNRAGESPLYLAVSSGFWDVPELIINNDPSSSASYGGANGQNALHPALYFLNYEHDKLRLLVNWKPEMIGKGDRLGLTPLHYAALYGRTEAIDLFLEIDRSAIDRLGVNGESALHFAAFKGNIDALEVIIKHRPDSCYLTDKKGRTALHAAVLGDQRKAIEFMLGNQKLSMLKNKQDSDGNTPLHLAALFKLYTVVEIFGSVKGVNLRVKNKKFSTPLDVYNQHTEEGLRASVIRDILKGSDGTMEMQRFAEEQMMKMQRDQKGEADENTMIREICSSAHSTPFLGKQNAMQLNQLVGTMQLNQLVGTLVATVTFAAGFSIPGGTYDDGDEAGLAKLVRKTAFQSFMVFNTIAFCSSVFAVLLQFHTTVTDIKQLQRYAKMAALFITVGFLSMVVAFAAGTYVVLVKSIGISITPYVICGFFAILYFSIPLCDPGVEGFPILNPIQKLVRGMVVKCVRYEE